MQKEHQSNQNQVEIIGNDSKFIFEKLSVEVELAKKRFLSEEEIELIAGGRNVITKN
jgi:hypothetical protein